MFSVGLCELPQDGETNKPCLQGDEHNPSLLQGDVHSSLYFQSNVYASASLQPSHLQSSPLVNNLQEVIHQYGYDKTYWVAFSGGLDSHVLLSLCHQLSQYPDPALSNSAVSLLYNPVLSHSSAGIQFSSTQIEASSQVRGEKSAKPPLKIKVIHVNHGISLNAEKWAKHCADTCALYGFELTVVSLNLKKQAGESLEEMARVGRYAAFAQHLQAGDVLLTAHHQDDQAETFLLQLLRGSGVKGLAAMPVEKQFAQGVHLRPLLTISREQLQAYAEAKSLTWVEDESNTNTVHARNYLRCNVLPMLKRYWPTAANLITRSAAHCAESQSLLDEYGVLLCDRAQGSQPDTLSVARLLLFSKAQQRLTLRTWLYQQGFAPPGAKKLDSLIHDALTAANDRFPCVAWGQTEVRRYQDDLYAMTALELHDPKQMFDWEVGQPLFIPGVGIVESQNMLGYRALVQGEKAVVKFRRGGEVIEWPGRGTQYLKNLFQEWQIVPWLRDRIPLIYVENKLVGIIRLS